MARANSAPVILLVDSDGRYFSSLVTSLEGGTVVERVSADRALALAATLPSAHVICCIGESAQALVAAVTARQHSRSRTPPNRPKSVAAPFRANALRHRESGVAFGDAVAMPNRIARRTVWLAMGCAILCAAMLLAIGLL